MTNTEMVELNKTCSRIRSLIIESIASVGVGHVGGSLSPVEALVALYYKHMNIDPKNPKLEARDRFVLSKGHAGPALYAVLQDKGYFEKEQLYTLNKPGTLLPSHVDMHRTKGIDMTAGSLGQGFSCAVGIALASKLRADGAYIYSMIGDGESDEGIIWEAAMYAANLKLSNLIAFTDYNKVQLDGTTDEINSLEPLTDKWAAFGWRVISVDGHKIEEIDEAIIMAKEETTRPVMIILNTIKGKGVSFIEEKGAANHSMSISVNDCQRAMQELKGDR